MITVSGQIRTVGQDMIDRVLIDCPYATITDVDRNHQPVNVVSSSSSGRVVPERENDQYVWIPKEKYRDQPQERKWFDPTREEWQKTNMCNNYYFGGT